MHQVASSYAEAFNELLDVYQTIGQDMPLLLQYQSVFQDNPHMVRVLTLMYEDILEFHRRALKYFQQRMWRQLFQATWKTFKSKFSGLSDSMRRHRSLIESQANLLQIEESQQSRAYHEAQFKLIRDAEESRRRTTVNTWLHAASTETDQYNASSIRSEYPETGGWLFDMNKFKAWFDPQFCSTPALWLNGIPGAGKTILASLVIERARKLTSTTVLFFYCRHDDSQRNSFVAVARGLISQILCQNDMLLSYLYEKASTSGEAVLTGPSLVKEILSMAIKNSERTYIILDGLDECNREDRKEITSWFRDLIDSPSRTDFGSIRCLFISQDDGPGRKDLSMLPTLKIRGEDNRCDIELYANAWSKKIQEKFELQDDNRDEIAGRIVTASGGMFLLAKLISRNLLDQTSQDSLDEELEPNVFPKEINQAYSRIIKRIFNDHISLPEKKDSLMLLGWLVCTKRPLKWHEIQGAKSIDIERRSVEMERRRFRVDSKDLCGSLVEIRGDGTVELVHLTAKLFLIDDRHIVRNVEELNMAVLCLNYLNLPGFCGDDIQSLLPKGYFAFFDYAVVYWVSHLEAGLSSDISCESLRLLAEGLDNFLDLHWASPKSRVVVSNRNYERLKQLKDYPFFDRLMQAAVASRKKLHFHGSTSSEEAILNLSGLVSRVRIALEREVSSASDDSSRCRLERLYGTNLFKCPRFSCDFFSAGFPNSEQREQHVSKHDRAYRCTIEGCQMAAFGCATAKDLDKHMADYHGLSVVEEVQFPSEFPARAPSKSPTNSRSSTPEPAAIPTSNLVSKSARKPKTPSVFQCPMCSKKFTRAYNLQAHRRTHTDERPFPCRICGKGFARQHDRKRHENLHSGEKKFYCRGTLQDGSEWGCGRGFALAAALARHYQSVTGQACIKQHLEEQAALQRYLNSQEVSSEDRALELAQKQG